MDHQPAAQPQLAAQVASLTTVLPSIFLLLDQIHEYTVDKVRTYPNLDLTKQHLLHLPSFSSFVPFQAFLTQLDQFTTLSPEFDYQSEIDYGWNGSEIQAEELLLPGAVEPLQNRPHPLLWGPTLASASATTTTTTTTTGSPSPSSSSSCDLYSMMMKPMERVVGLLNQHQFSFFTLHQTTQQWTIEPAPFFIKTNIADIIKLSYNMDNNTQQQEEKPTSNQPATSLRLTSPPTLASVTQQLCTTLSSLVQHHQILQRKHLLHQIFYHSLRAQNDPAVIMDLGGFQYDEDLYREKHQVCLNLDQMNLQTFSNLVTLNDISDNTFGIPIENSSITGFGILDVVGLYYQIYYEQFIVPFLHHAKYLAEQSASLSQQYHLDNNSVSNVRTYHYNCQYVSYQNDYYHDFDKLLYQHNNSSNTTQHIHNANETRSYPPPPHPLFQTPTLLSLHALHYQSTNHLNQLQQPHDPFFHQILFCYRAFNTLISTQLDLGSFLQSLFLLTSDIRSEITRKGDSLNKDNTNDLTYSTPNTHHPQSTLFRKSPHEIVASLNLPYPTNDNNRDYQNGDNDDDDDDDDDNIGSVYKLTVKAKMDLVTIFNQFLTNQLEDLNKFQLLPILYPLSRILLYQSAYTNLTIAQLTTSLNQTLMSLQLFSPITQGMNNAFPNQNSLLTSPLAHYHASNHRNDGDNTIGHHDHHPVLIQSEETLFFSRPLTDADSTSQPSSHVERIGTGSTVNSYTGSFNTNNNNTSSNRQRLASTWYSSLETIQTYIQQQYDVISLHTQHSVEGMYQFTKDYGLDRSGGDEFDAANAALHFLSTSDGVGSGQDDDGDQPHTSSTGNNNLIESQYWDSLRQYQGYSQMISPLQREHEKKQQAALKQMYILNYYIMLFAPVLLSLDVISNGTVGASVFDMVMGDCKEDWAGFGHGLIRRRSHSKNTKTKKSSAQPANNNFALFFKQSLSLSHIYTVLNTIFNESYPDNNTSKKKTPTPQDRPLRSQAFSHFSNRRLNLFSPQGFVSPYSYNILTFSLISLLNSTKFQSFVDKMALSLTSHSTTNRICNSGSSRDDLVTPHPTPHSVFCTCNILESINSSSNQVDLDEDDDSQDEDGEDDDDDLPPPIQPQASLQLYDLRSLHNTIQKTIFGSSSDNDTNPNTEPTTTTSQTTTSSLPHQLQSQLSSALIAYNSMTDTHLMEVDPANQMEQLYSNLSKQDTHHRFVVSMLVNLFSLSMFLPSGSAHEIKTGPASSRPNHTPTLSDALNPAYNQSTHLQHICQYLGVLLTALNAPTNHGQLAKTQESNSDHTAALPSPTQAEPQSSQQKQPSHPQSNETIIDPYGEIEALRQEIKELKEANAHLQSTVDKLQFEKLSLGEMIKALKSPSSLSTSLSSSQSLQMSSGSILDPIFPSSSLTSHIASTGGGGGPGNVLAAGIGLNKNKDKLKVITQSLFAGMSPFLLRDGRIVFDDNRIELMSLVSALEQYSNDPQPLMCHVMGVDSNFLSSQHYPTSSLAVNNNNNNSTNNKNNTALQLSSAQFNTYDSLSESFNHQIDNLSLSSSAAGGSSQLVATSLTNHNKTTFTTALNTHTLTQTNLITLFSHLFTPADLTLLGTQPTLFLTLLATRIQILSNLNLIPQHKTALAVHRALTTVLYPNRPDRPISMSVARTIYLNIIIPSTLIHSHYRVHFGPQFPFNFNPPMNRDRNQQLFQTHSLLRNIHRSQMLHGDVYGVLNFQQYQPKERSPLGFRAWLSGWFRNHLLIPAAVAHIYQSHRERQRLIFHPERVRKGLRNALVTMRSLIKKRLQKIEDANRPEEGGQAPHQHQPELNVPNPHDYTLRNTTVDRVDQFIQQMTDIFVSRPFKALLDLIQRQQMDTVPIINLGLDTVEVNTDLSTLPKTLDGLRYDTSGEYRLYCSQQVDKSTRGGSAYAVFRLTAMVNHEMLYQQNQIKARQQHEQQQQQQQSIGPSNNNIDDDNDNGRSRPPSAHLSPHRLGFTSSLTDLTGNLDDQQSYNTFGSRGVWGQFTDLSSPSFSLTTLQDSIRNGASSDDGDVAMWARGNDYEHYNLRSRQVELIKSTLVVHSEPETASNPRSDNTTTDPVNKSPRNDGGSANTTASKRPGDYQTWLSFNKNTSSKQILMTPASLLSFRSSHNPELDPGMYINQLSEHRLLQQPTRPPQTLAEIKLHRYGDDSDDDSTYRQQISGPGHVTDSNKTGTPPKTKVPPFSSPSSPFGAEHLTAYINTMFHGSHFFNNVYNEGLIDQYRGLLNTVKDSGTGSETTYGLQPTTTAQSKKTPLSKNSLFDVLLPFTSLPTFPVPPPSFAQTPVIPYLSKSSVPASVISAFREYKLPFARSTKIQTELGQNCLVRMESSAQPPDSNIKSIPPSVAIVYTLHNPSISTSTTTTTTATTTPTTPTTAANSQFTIEPEKDYHLEQLEHAFTLFAAYFYSILERPQLISYSHLLSDSSGPPAPALNSINPNPPSSSFPRDIAPISLLGPLQLIMCVSLVHDQIRAISAVQCLDHRKQAYKSLPSSSITSSTASSLGSSAAENNNASSSSPHASTTALEQSAAGPRVSSSYIPPHSQCYDLASLQDLNRVTIDLNITIGEIKLWYYSLVDAIKQQVGTTTPTATTTTTTSSSNLLPTHYTFLKTPHSHANRMSNPKLFSAIQAIDDDPNNMVKLNMLMTRLSDQLKGLQTFYSVESNGSLEYGIMDDFENPLARNPSKVRSTTTTTPTGPASATATTPTGATPTAATTSAPTITSSPHGGIASLAPSMTLNSMAASSSSLPKM